MPAQRCPAQRIGRGPHDRCLDQRRIGQDDRQRQQCQGEGEGRPAPGTERHQPRRARSAADRRIAAPPEQQSLALQQQDRRDEQRHRRGRGEVRLRRMLKQRPDLGRDDVEAGRHREDRRHAELCQRLDESDEPAGQQRRQYHRQRHPAQRVPAAAAKDRRGVLEIGRNVVERVGDQHEDIRKAVAGHREDDAVCGVDVEDMLVFAEPEPLAGEPVEDAAVRGGEDFPGDRAEKGRGHERGGDKGADEPTQRQVGARHQPGERQGRRGRPQRNAGGDFERRQIGSREARIGRQTHEIGRSQRAVIIGDAVPDEPAERQQNQPAQKQREQHHDRPRQVDRRGLRVHRRAAARWSSRQHDRPRDH